MNSEEFIQILTQQMGLCEDVLSTRLGEYATDDRLHNFKVAAALQGVPVRQALAGMLAKHTVPYTIRVPLGNQDLWPGSSEMIA